MRKGLLRVLEVRRLLEEQSSLDLQARTAELRRLENRAEEQRRLAAETRNEAVGQRRDDAAVDTWLGIADAEIFSWKRAQIEVAARQVRGQVATLGERRMTRRIERQQAEDLVTRAVHAEEEERNRREQRHLDDWVQTSSSSRLRRSQ